MKVTTTVNPRLGKRFCDALAFTAEIAQTRIRAQGEPIPHIADLLAVASLVLEADGTEDEAIAALLMTSTTDLWLKRDRIATHFGEAIAQIIDQVSVDRDLPLELRNPTLIQQINNGTPSAIRVCAAAMLHDLRFYALPPNRGLWSKELQEMYEALLIPAVVQSAAVPDIWWYEFCCLMAQVSKAEWGYSAASWEYGATWQSAIEDRDLWKNNPFKTTPHKGE